MTPKTSNPNQKLFLWSGIVGTFLLLIIGTLLLWHKNRPPREPIKIYKAVPIEEINTNRSMSQSTKVGTQNLPNAEKLTIQEHTHDGHTHTHGTVAMSELQETTTSDPNHTATENAGSSETEELTLEELDALAHQSWHAKWEKEMLALAAAVNARYPDLVDLVSVPPEEWQSRYPTLEAFEALGERIDAMQREFQSRLRNLIAEMPAPFRAQFFAAAKFIVKANWGNEVLEAMEKEGIF